MKADPHLIPSSGYEPQEGDDRLMRDQVFLDLDESQIVIEAGQPAQVSLKLKGYLSDPCHQLRVVVLTGTQAHEIFLEAYSLYDPHKACITVIKDFVATISFGGLTPGPYKVFVNDQLFKPFDL